MLHWITVYILFVHVGKFHRNIITKSKGLCICKFDKYCWIAYHWVVPIYPPISTVWENLFLHSFTNTVIANFSNFANLIGEKSCLGVFEFAFLLFWAHLFITKEAFKIYVQGLPWWCSGWESACQCRGHGFEPWSGRVPHAAERLGPWATIAKPARLEPVLRNKRGPWTTMKSGPRLLQLEKALAQKRRPNTAINK